jgi:hypothetical protein
MKKNKKPLNLMAIILMIAVAALSIGISLSAIYLLNLIIK